MNRRILVAAVALLAQPLSAQSPVQRRQLAAWGDTLARATTTAELAAIAPHAGEGDKALRQLRRAFLNARRGELDHDRGAFERALFDFDQASARHGDWPWPEYALATVFRQFERGNYPVTASAGQFDGESHPDATWRHLRNALRRDATMPEVRQFAIALMVAAGDRELPAVQEEALDRLIGVPEPGADALLVLGRSLRGRRRYDSALVAFDQSLAAGGDASRLGLERARTLRALGDSTAAVAAYWEGARRLTPTGRAAYRSDLAWIVDPDSLVSLDAAPNDSVLPWLKRFWAERDVHAAKSADGRLSEQLHRWSIAFANFKVTAPWRRTMFTRVEFGFEPAEDCIGRLKGFYEQLARTPPVDPDDLRRREPLLDHRGLIYLRHGQPVMRRANSAAIGASAIRAVGIATPQLQYNVALSQSAADDLDDSRAGTEIWLYAIDGEWRALLFRGSKALGTGAATTLATFLPMSYVTEWYYLAQALPEYSAAAQRLAYYRGILPRSCLPEVTAAIKSSQADASVGISTDSDSPVITRPWNAVLNIFAVGAGQASTGRALITFALPSDKLLRSPRDSGHFGIDVRFRLSAFDRISGRSVQLDTVRHFAATGATRPNQYLSGLFELPLQPGRWDISVLARQQSDSAGGFAELRDHAITAGDRLALSDIVTGIGTGRLFWSAGDAPFPLNVLGVWTPKSPMEIYYEVYGLPAETGYRTTIEVRPAGARKGKVVTLSTSDVSRGTTSVIRRTIGLEQLSPGAYRLIVTIAHGSDRAVSERPLLIVKP